jgi:hypothetical protein
MEFANEYQDAMKYFHEIKQIPKLNRQFIINVLNICIGENFRLFIHNRKE